MRTHFACLACLLLMTVFLAQASGSTPTITQLSAFYCNNAFTSCPYGIEPTISPVQLSNDDLYGVTWWAGKGNPNAGGTVWKVTTSGTLSVVHTFLPNKTAQFPKGENPVIGFVQGSDHNLYGITEQGGSTNQGVMYKLLPTGQFKILHDFCTGRCTDIQGPIILGQDGNFYGVQTGGEVIFRITPQGVYSVVHTLNPSTEGRAGVLIQGTNGNFYGTGSIGSACETKGTVFTMTPSGTVTILATFGTLDFVSNTLVQASDGNFYGSVAGTIFQMTPAGAVKTIYTLQGEDGSTVIHIPT